ncbi:MAG: TlpA disulfide reductase family protein [Chloroflexota bacterium]|nr:TlpA family protein disulfide reductase [Dehalococcoidia bacterium]MDW8253341.1 TlpA disulfide reductase family protein [Chloroflexota bacterium]
MRLLGVSIFVGFFVCLLLSMVGIVGLRFATLPRDAPVTALDTSATARVNDPAPLFTARTLQGEAVNLANYRGKLVILNFWASWCGPCRSEMPAIEAASIRYRDAGVVFLGVNVQEASATVTAFVDEFKLTFPILLDPNGAISAVYRVRSLPTTFFIDRDGILREQFTGEMNASVIDRRVRLYSDPGP